MLTIDVHTHAFPDKLAAKAIASLEAEAPCRACLDGRLGSLIASMDRSGVDVSVIGSIATRREQFGPILAWSLQIASRRIVPFVSVHPDDADALAHLREAADAGIAGVKLHPYYQGFTVDEPRMMRLYSEIERLGLVLLLHAGFDIAFAQARIANPARVVEIAGRFPRLKLIAAHLGGWQDWDEAERLLLGRRVCLDVSYCLTRMPEDQARRFLTGHPAEYLLFGSDSPWADQADALAEAGPAGLPAERREAFAGGNAARLLGLRPTD